MAERVYFRGLDGLRALAATGVMISHSLVALKRFPGHSPHRGLELAGQSVIVFFTLSGFLITYLLLQEREELGRIDLRAFYMRRILRIWPLYFFYIILAMAYHWAADPGGVANAGYVILFVCFVPNIAFNLDRYMPDTAPLWSIGIEEQFYAVWPLIVRHVRNLERVLVGVIVCVVGVRFALHLRFGGSKHLATSIVDSVGYDSMAIGALCAFAYRRGSARVMKLARSAFVQVGFIVWLALLAANVLGPLSARADAADVHIYWTLHPGTDRRPQEGCRSRAPRPSQRRARVIRRLRLSPVDDHACCADHAGTRATGMVTHRDDLRDEHRSGDRVVSRARAPVSAAQEPARAHQDRCVIRPGRARRVRTGCSPRTRPAIPGRCGPRPRATPALRTDPRRP